MIPSMAYSCGIVCWTLVGRSEAGNVYAWLMRKLMVSPEAHHNDLKKKTSSLRPTCSSDT
jgi:hypothetical protein